MEVELKSRYTEMCRRSNEDNCDDPYNSDGNNSDDSDPVAYDGFATMNIAVWVGLTYI